MSQNPLFIYYSQIFAQVQAVTAVRIGYPLETPFVWFYDLPFELYVPLAAWVLTLYGVSVTIPLLFHPREKARQPSVAPSLWRRGPVVSWRAVPQQPAGIPAAALQKKAALARNVSRSHHLLLPFPGTTICQIYDLLLTL